jgi:hypothetical protein
LEVGDPVVEEADRVPIEIILVTHRTNPSFGSHVAIAFSSSDCQ